MRARGLANSGARGVRRNRRDSELTRFPAAGTIALVRSVCAIVLLGVFSFAMAVPIVFADSDSQLPACCRRNGKHHCAMAGLEPSSGPAFQAPLGHCPLYPAAGTVSLHSDPVLAAAPQILFAAVVSHPAYHAQTEAHYRASFSRSRQKRGPPILLS